MRVFTWIAMLRVLADIGCQEVDPRHVAREHRGVAAAQMDLGGDQMLASLPNLLRVLNFIRAHLPFVQARKRSVLPSRTAPFHARVRRCRLRATGVPRGEQTRRFCSCPHTLPNSLRSV